MTEWQRTDFDLGATVEYETNEDMLRACVQALGGSKQAGYLLWPTKGVEGARAHLLACIDPHRAEKFGFDALMRLFKLSAERGCHAGMEHMCRILGYAPPVQLKPADEFAELQRRFERTVEQSRHIAEQMQSYSERIAGSQKLKRVG